MRWLLLAGLLASPTTAVAAGLLDAVAAEDCKEGRLDNADLRDKIFAANKVVFSSKLLHLANTGALGTELERLADNCDPTQGCKDDKAALPNAFDAVRPLRDSPLEQKEGFTIIVDEATAPPPPQRPVRFLDGDWAWLTISCKADAIAPKAPTPPPADRFFMSPGLVIAKSEEDAGKAFDKRGFATVGFSRDEVADEQTLDVDLFVGFGDPFRRRESSLTFQPLFSYQRHSKKKVDDLALGMAAITYPGAGGQVRLKGAWESDHEFEASVWRADLSWTTPWLDACEEQSTDSFYASCEFGLVADYADIGDPGEKEALAKMSSFGRVGGSLLLEADVRAGDAGFVTLSGRYSGLHDVSGHDADAELGVVSLGFVPSKKGSYRVSLDYTHGRDLTSLAKQRTLVLSFGFRR